MGSDHEQEVVCSNPTTTTTNNNNNSSIFRILFDEKQSYVTEAKALLSNYLIDSKELELGDCTGVGSSGIVYKALYKDQNVAVKVLKGTLSRGSGAAKAEDKIRRSSTSSETTLNSNDNGGSAGQTFQRSTKTESKSYFYGDSKTFRRSVNCESNIGNGYSDADAAFQRSEKRERNGNGDGETFSQSANSENNNNGNADGDGEALMRRSRSEGDQLGRNKTEGEFRREVLSLISCVHKNILKLYGVCISPHLSICIVTKFMQGGSLLHYLQRRKSLKICEILKLAKDVAKGMKFLHSRGIVHMDLKTANVFLDEEGNAVIGDLGVARLANEVEDGDREIGTYRWMAPEVCRAESGRGGGFSYKSDVYSYGILVWELVTCKIPFVDYSPVQAAVGVVMHGLRPPIPPACFPPLRYLIQKCWDQDPSVRPHFSQILKMLHIISHQDWS